VQLSQTTRRSLIDSQSPAGFVVECKEMQAVAMREVVRGVYCRNCGKPLRLSPSLIQREATIRLSLPEAMPELKSRVFSARCRECLGESVYTLNQVVDLTGASI
jgi:hypothetical protein